MPTKSARQSAKYKEQQYRKRMAAQARTTAPPAELTGTENGTVETATRPQPAAPPTRLASAGNGTAVAARPGLTPRAGGMTMPSAVRTARGRVAAQIQQMNLEDEMHFIRGDIRRLLIMAAVSFAILIVLAFVIQ